MHFIAFVLLCFAMLLPSANAATGIAAIVNDDIITTSDIDGRFGLMTHGSQMKMDDKVRAQLRKQALESLIDEQIRLQEADRLGVTPDKKEIDEALSRLAAQNNTTQEKFKSAIQKSGTGIYDSLRRQLKTQIAWANVVRKKIRPQVNITENDINNYLTEKAKNPANVEYHVAEIFMKNTPDNRELMNRLVSELRSGKQRFSNIARQFSEGLEASKGGMLGWIPEKRLEPVLDEAIARTSAGSISDPIVSPRGLHIFFVLEKRAILAAEEGSMRLNLKQLVVPLPPTVPDDIVQKAMAQAKFFQAEAKDCTAIDDVIKKIDHPLSRDLGEVRLADLPPAVLSQVKDLAIGTASDPVRIKEGLGVFMVCGRTENAEEMVRDDAANTLGTDRLNRLQYRYYRDLRASSYVDVK